MFYLYGESRRGNPGVHGVKRLRPQETIRDKHPQTKVQREYPASWVTHASPSKLEVRDWWKRDLNTQLSLFHLESEFR